MEMESKEIQECIDFTRNVIRDMAVAVRMAGGGPMAEMAAAIGTEKHEKTLQALEEYKAYKVTKELLEVEE